MALPMGRAIIQAGKQCPAAIKRLPRRSAEYEKKERRSRFAARSASSLLLDVARLVQLPQPRV